MALCNLVKSQASGGHEENDEFLIQFVCLRCLKILLLKTVGEFRELLSVQPVFVSVVVVSLLC